MSLHETITQYVQEVMTRLFDTADRQPRLAFEAAEPAADLQVDERHVRSVLKGRRSRKRRRTFHGFDSPPGRF